jgi:hypothetical protein
MSIPLWEDVPEDVLVRVLLELDFDSRVSTTLVCKRWRQCHDRAVKSIRPQPMTSVMRSCICSHAGSSIPSRIRSLPLCLLS